MINPKELRIGNLVYWKYVISEISVIGNQAVRFNTDAKTESCVFEPKEIHPIPLTHELLLKIGADYDDHRPFDEFYDFESYYFECSKLTNVAIHYSHNNKKFYYPKYEIAPIEYLHQLQNLYFALTGEELEIKL